MKGISDVEDDTEGSSDRDADGVTVGESESDVEEEYKNLINGAGNSGRRVSKKMRKLRGG